MPNLTIPAELFDRLVQRCASDGIEPDAAVAVLVRRWLSDRAYNAKMQDWLTAMCAKDGRSAAPDVDSKASP